MDCHLKYHTRSSIQELDDPEFEKKIGNTKEIEDRTIWLIETGLLEAKEEGAEEPTAADALNAEIRKKSLDNLPNAFKNPLINKYDRVICPKCRGRVFTDISIYIRHVQQYHMGQSTPQPKRNYRTALSKLPEEFNKPLLDENKRFICPKSPTRNFKDTDNYVKHVQVYHLHPKVECPNCLQTYLKKYLKRHLAKCGGKDAPQPPEKEKCPFCGEYFGNVKVHIRYTHDEKPYKCTDCPRRFSLKSYLTAHYRTHLGFTKKWYKLCTVCGKEFSSRGLLEEHMITHANGKLFACDICGTEFTTNKAVVVHRRIHTGERPHPCGFCDMAFRTQALKIKHIKRKHTEQPYECDDCGERFRTLGQKLDHQSMHYDDNNVKT